MKNEKYIPCESLRPFVKRFMIVESDDGMRNRILPDSSLVMAFRFKGCVTHTTNSSNGELPAAVISGLRRSPRAVSYEKNSAILLVTFHEGCASFFIDTPLHTLFEEMVALENFIPAQTIRDATDQLATAPSNPRRITIIEQFLLKQLDRYTPDALIGKAIEQINFHKGTYRIKNLAEDLCISGDAFEKRFRKIVGTSPKQFSNIIRMKSIIQSGYQSNDLAALAYQANYFDQAHFTKEFKVFTGQTPQVFFRTRPLW